MSFVAAIVITSILTDQSKFDQRARDWRNGATIYQVFVDRFTPSTDLARTKKNIIPPRSLKSWKELPTPGSKIENLGVYTHEIEFWGGDLKGIANKIGYISDLGMDCLYLTPIFKAFTNHRYDTLDYKAIAPELGTTLDLWQLRSLLHKRGMKIMLDGVFNHMGRGSHIFQDALKNPNSKYRKWFYFGKQYPLGYRGWAGVSSLPALNLENKEVRDFLINKVVKPNLQNMIDGWRLDVAFELGPRYLSEITGAAHSVNARSSVVGEISGYPSNWFPSVDGVFNFFAPGLVIHSLFGKMSGGRVSSALQEMVDNAGIEHLLKSWVLLDNHDTPRIADVIPNLSKRKVATAVQFTLPGCPVVYYGSELGMAGQGDPQNRAPMQWELANDSNLTLDWYKKVSRIRKTHRALRIGDFKSLNTGSLIGYIRFTDQLPESVIVLANPTDRPVTETIPLPIGRLMSWGQIKDLISGAMKVTVNGILSVEMNPNSVAIFVPVISKNNGYSAYDRID